MAKIPSVSTQTPYQVLGGVSEHEMFFLRAGGGEEKQETVTLHGNEGWGRSAAPEETLNWALVVRDDFLLEARA